MEWLGQPGLTRRLWGAVAISTLYAAVVTVVDESLFYEYLSIRPQMHALLGTILGLFLGFRTNTAYDRWWEGRKLWGQLVNDSRNLAIKVRSFSRIDAGETARFGKLLISFARALKEHLREGVVAKQLTVYKDMPAEPRHVPAHIALQLRAMVSAWSARGSIDRWQEMMLDRHIGALMDICGACERIRRTPMVTSYRFFLRQGIVLYLVSLPWGLVHDFEYWTIPAVLIVSYFMVGMEMIAEDVEEPFGRTVDDLKLDAICDVIDATVSETLTATVS